MPFSGNTYTLPSGVGSTATGQIISPTLWNLGFNDLATALGQLGSGAVLYPEFLLGKGVVASGSAAGSLGDTSIAITSPTTNYMVTGIIVTDASGALTGGSASLFTGSVGGGVSVTGTAANALTVTSGTAGVAASLQTITPPASGVLLSGSPLFWHQSVKVASGSPTYNVYLFGQGLP